MTAIMRGSVRYRAIVLLSLWSAAVPALANQCAAPGSAGTATPSGVVNSYYPGTASVAAGSTSLTVGAAGGANTAIAAGDLLLVIQMQDATVDSSNTDAYGDGVTGGFAQGYTAIGQSGLYEFVRAGSAVGVGGGTLTIIGQGGASGLLNSYNNAAATTTAGQKRFQVVRVPQYVDATVAGTVTPLSWDGTKGGVIAVDVANRLTLSGGRFDASGTGFRGGGITASGTGAGVSTDYRTAASGGANGSKGEGVVGTPRLTNSNGTFVDTGIEGYPNGTRARGAPGNAGGGGTDGQPSSNDQNTGGGGGGNGGAGGLGGYAWCNPTGTGCPQTGGHPGARIAQAGVSRITMGGGGGSGSNNNATGVPGSGYASSGAAGGGLILVRAGEIAGSGTFSADGASANNTVLNDGSGGGGAGGSILVSAVRSIAGASILATARGGNGGTNDPAGSGAHGPGGGGGGGFIATTGPASTIVLGGNNGTTQASTNYGTTYGATPGTGGAGIAITGASIPGLSSGGECTPVVSKAFARPTALANQTNALSVTVVNPNPTLALTALGFTDTYPANIINTATPAPTKSCSTAATLAAAAGGGTLNVSAATISAASSCTYTVNTQATTTGSYTNTIAPGALTGSYGTVATTNRVAASAGVTVSAPLSIAKASVVYSDPANGTTLPKAVPGAFVTYTITVTNPGTAAADNNSITITDPTASNLALFVGDIGASGSGPVLFTDGAPSSALTYSYAAIGDTADDLAFSNDGAATWSYVPVPAPTLQTDPAVTTIRLQPKGAMAAGSSFTMQFRYRVN